tara:strand:+ start:1490 stop:1888 length:399 start_codon:yes stop_codon:yes gene_type:complete
METIDLRNKIDRPKFSVKRTLVININKDSQYIAFYSGPSKSYETRGIERRSMGGWTFRRLLASGKWKRTKQGWMRVYSGWMFNGPFKKSLTCFRRWYDLKITSEGWKKIRLITYDRAYNETYDQIKLIKNAL